MTIEDFRRVCEPLEQERRRQRGEKLAGNLALIFMVGLWLYFWWNAGMEMSK
jgi:predicted nucleic acid-binding Zn ribbon protein